MKYEEIERLDKRIDETFSNFQTLFRSLQKQITIQNEKVTELESKVKELENKPVTKTINNNFYGRRK